MTNDEIEKLAEAYAYAMIGGLAFSWGIPLDRIKEKEKQNADFLKAHFIFFWRDIIEDDKTGIQ